MRLQQKRSSIYVIRVSWKEKKGRALKNTQRNNSKTLSIFGKIYKPTDQEIKQISYRKKAKKSTPRHIIFKLLKTKDKKKLLKTTKEPWFLTYRRGKTIQMTTYFLSEIVQEMETVCVLTVNINILAMILYCWFVPCYHWEKLRNMSSLCTFFLRVHVNL